MSDVKDHGISVNELILTFEAQGNKRTMFQDACLAHLSRLADLERENAGLREDAARFVYYFDPAREPPKKCPILDMALASLSPPYPTIDQWRAAIDTARQKEG